MWGTSSLVFAGLWFAGRERVCLCWGVLGIWLGRRKGMGSYIPCSIILGMMIPHLWLWCITYLLYSSSRKHTKMPMRHALCTPLFLFYMYGTSSLFFAGLWRSVFSGKEWVCLCWGVLGKGMLVIWWSDTKGYIGSYIVNRPNMGIYVRIRQ